VTGARRDRGRRAGRLLLLWLGAAACGGSQKPGGEDIRNTTATPPAATDPRTALERRRDVACEQLGPRLTACAVEDAKADLAAGKISQQQLERDTAIDIQRKNTEQFETACKGSAYSSRQVRVLEVCPREETQCGPLLACLGHLTDAPSGGAK